VLTVTSTVELIQTNQNKLLLFHLSIVVHSFEASSMRVDDDDEVDVKNNCDEMKQCGRSIGASSNEEGDTFKLAPYNPSSYQIQQLSVAMMDLGKDDILFDLGCGDGRVLCFAATNTPGLRCVGIEIEEQYVTKARELVKHNNLESRIDIRLEDATKAVVTESPVMKTGVRIDKEEEKALDDLTLLYDATALYLFILPKGIVKMMPILQSLRRKRKDEGKRLKVLSYMFKIHDWEPARIDATKRGNFPVYYYVFEP